MKSVAENRINSIKSMYPRSQFIIGFHAMPSIKQLHLHLISTDFHSPRLKNKKHWNSFTTPFFLSIDFVINELKSKGRLFINESEYNQYLNEPLRCYHCQTILKNIPSLKSHLESHLNESILPQSSNSNIIS